MKKRNSKRYQQIKNLLIHKNIYSLDEAIILLTNIRTFNFLETIEAHISLNIDPKYCNQQLRTLVDLPHGNGKNIKIAILTNIQNTTDLLKMGADIVGFDNLIEEIKQGNLNFDILLTSREFMPKLTTLGKILGPKSLMPSLKFGTITEDFKSSIEEFKKGKVEYRADKTGIVHVGIGKLNFSPFQIKENFLALYNSIEKNKPQGVKGKYLRSIYLCSTMSPSICIDLQSLK